LYVACFSSSLKHFSIFKYFYTLKKQVAFPNKQTIYTRTHTITLLLKSLKISLKFINIPVTEI